MVVRHEKKSVKMRGSKTHGYGSKKKHRGSGSHGGKGHAGSHKHKIHHYIKYEPDHFGKRGFHSIPQRFGKKPSFINLSELSKLAEELGKNEIDLRSVADRLLGRGEIKKAITVRVKYASRIAREKIEKAGGKVLAE